MIGRFEPCDLVFRMLESPDAWIAVIRFAEFVLTAKEVTEHKRQASQGVAQSRGGGR